VYLRLHNKTFYTSFPVANVNPLKNLLESFADDLFKHSPSSVVSYKRLVLWKPQKGMSFPQVKRVGNLLRSQIRFRTSRN